MVIKEHGVQSKLIFCAKSAVTEAFEFFFILLTDAADIFHVCGHGSERSFFSLYALFFRMSKSIVEGECTAGNFVSENLPGKSFKFPVFRNSMRGKISGSNSNNKSKNKAAGNKKRRFFLQDIERHRESFLRLALYYHIGKKRNL